MARIAWIGLGNMGAPMTANLVKAGHEVTGFDLSADALAHAAEGGVSPTTNIADAVKDADVVFTMLPKGDHVRQVLDGPDGIWANAPTSALLIDSSTVDIPTSRWSHDESAARGFRFVDAPVSGGISGAAAGTLAFMIGGANEADMDEAAAVIEPMAGKIVKMGAPTTGIAAKLVNNMMLGIGLLAVSEGSQLAKQLGLDPQRFWDVASNSSGDSWPLRTWYPVPGIVDSAAANQNFDATFSAMLAHKDVALAVAAGDDVGLPLTGAHVILDQLQTLLDEGLGGKDCSLVAKFAAKDGELDGYTPDAA